MTSVGDEHWTERPMKRLEKELGKERFNIHGVSLALLDQGFQDKELETGLGTDRLDVQREVRNVKGKVESIKGSLFLNFSRRRSQEEVEIKV